MAAEQARNISINVNKPLIESIVEVIKDKIYEATFNGKRCIEFSYLSLTDNHKLQIKPNDFSLVLPSAISVFTSIGYKYSTYRIRCRKHNGTIYRLEW